jgi:hypothetical protein
MMSTTAIVHVCPSTGSDAAPGTDLSSATVETVRLKHLVEVRGKLREPVRKVALRGITFRHTARTFLENKEPLMRSDWTIFRGGAPFFTGTEDCAIEDCTFDQLGGSGVFASGYNRRLVVRRTEIDRVGTNALAFVGMPEAVRSAGFNYDEITPVDQLDLTPGPASEDYPVDCLVEDCLLTRFGQTEKQCAGVQIQMAARITVRQCSIYDCPRAGINIGDGCWGGHLIEGNDVFDTVKETGDHGCFNSWGRDRYWHPRIGDASSDADPQRDSINKKVAAYPGLELLNNVETTILRRNRWRYDQDHRWGWDVDLDDGSSNYLIEDNLCLNHGIKLREGFHRTVRNNVCIQSGLHAHCWPVRTEDVVTGNILCGGHAPPIHMPLVWGREIDRNLFSDPLLTRQAMLPSDQRDPQVRAEGLRRAQVALAEAQARGTDRNSIVSDPQFLHPARGDFRVADGSPALALGFRNFPMDRFGVQTPRLKAKARHAQNTPLIQDREECPGLQAVSWLRAKVKTVSESGEVTAASSEMG